MLGDRTRIAEVHIFVAIALLGAAAYSLTLAAKASAKGRDDHRRKVTDLTLEAKDHDERRRDAEEALRDRPTRERTIVSPPEGPGTITP